jgi:pimeloyl-ACP methyl ester carboxylesterase
MTIAKAIIKWVLIIVLGLIVFLILFIESFDRYISSERGVKWLYRNIPEQPMDIRYTSSGVRYLSIGHEDKIPMLLIHGAPGSAFDWTSFAKQLDIYDQYYLLIVERPGYGATIPRRAEPSIKIQSEKIAEVLREENIKEAVVMGHSYGAPIAIALGAIAPQHISHIYGLSGQYDPDNEVTFKISHYVNFNIFKYLLPRLVWVSNIEKLTHPDGLREIQPYFESVKVPITLIHGDADTLVPYENSTFLKSKLKQSSSSLITLDGHDHPIHMQIPGYLANLALGRSPAVPRK